MTFESKSCSHRTRRGCYPADATLRVTEFLAASGCCTNCLNDRVSNAVHLQLGDPCRSGTVRRRYTQAESLGAIGFALQERGRSGNQLRYQCGAGDGVETFRAAWYSDSAR
jgi:hypothetical protein